MTLDKTPSQATILATSPANPLSPKRRPRPASRQACRTTDWRVQPARVSQPSRRLPVAHEGQRVANNSTVGARFTAQRRRQAGRRPRTIQCANVRPRPGIRFASYHPVPAAPPPHAAPRPTRPPCRETVPRTHHQADRPSRRRVARPCSGASACIFPFFDAPETWGSSAGRAICDIAGVLWHHRPIRSGGMRCPFPPPN
jgi:hypothetical protein